MLVYRQSWEQFASSHVVAALKGALQTCAASRNEDDCLDALMRAGELECALADSDASSEPAQIAAGITDTAAQSLLQCRSASDYCWGIQNAFRSLELLASHLPATLVLRPPEGFAFYALHPLMYAAVADELDLPPCVAVLGIRSIGTALSSVVAGAARDRGCRSERITVRPSGAPYDRELRFTALEVAWIRSKAARGAGFLIVDEGPGRSGSSFLAVAEALERSGVAPHRITIMCSYEPNLDALLAPSAASRWKRFRAVWPRSQSRPLPPAADPDLDLSAGKWRRFFSSCSTTPSWVETERLKFLSREDSHKRPSLLKFEGYGRFGKVARTRATALTEVGFATQLTDADRGFLDYDLLPGPAAHPGDLRADTLVRLAEYCATRSQRFAATATDCEPIAIMAAQNLLEEFGSAPEIELQLLRPCICDGHMQPYEWVHDGNGVLRKTDGCSHGDDHFFPGPCDIAWDLAGCIVEWEMDGSTADAFIRDYELRSGDRVRLRLRSWILAYCAFRIGWTAMAAGSTHFAERPALQLQHRRYRETARAICEGLSRPARGHSVQPLSAAQSSA
jgi:hypothetical protein